MAKRLSEKEKEEMVNCFIIGNSIDQLSADFNCSKLTITRNLKKSLGEKKYKKFIDKNSSLKTCEYVEERIIPENKNDINTKDSKEKHKDEFYSVSSFVEISPLDYEIDYSKQRDFSSIPISEIQFPKIVYMVVDKKIELEIKYLQDFPDWQFLAKDELKRKTIEIFQDLKHAKRSCNREQKVIKVPNSEVFRIVAPILVSRGISRIVSDDKLIAL